MKLRNRTAKKFGLGGAGVGLTLFALVGLLQGSMIGGAIGLGIVNSVLGGPAGTTLLSRVVVGASMLAGIIVTGIAFIGISAGAAWAAGYVIGWLAEPKGAAEHAGSGPAK